ncbi:MAG: hypothetical protein MUE85_12280 [Microscillaceae bacterium]|jgi:hypothetical protein|nr:hypothetical protein [Microscillaceae bacterium]
MITCALLDYGFGVDNSTLTFLIFEPHSNIENIEKYNFYKSLIIIELSLRSHKLASALGGQARADMPWLVSPQAIKRKPYNTIYQHLLTL